MAHYNHITSHSPHINLNNGTGNSISHGQQPNTDPILIGNANTVIRFMGVMFIVLLLAFGYVFREIGVLNERVGTIEDVVILQRYKIEPVKGGV